MHRRKFLGASAVATIAGLNTLATEETLAQQSGSPVREYYELRTYAMKSGADQKPLLGYLQNAAIPALNRLGATKVGVFTELDKAESPFIAVLIPYPSLESFATAATRLSADAKHQQAAAEYLALPKASAAYARVESSLMIAFEGMPRLVLPSLTTDQKPRIFELRIYESHSEAAGLKKIEMFNKGEIEIMRRVGLGPVFFGQTLIGGRMPNLTYMLSGESRDEHKKHWAAFGGDAEWKKIRAIPEYADSAILSGITSKFLAPTAFSQI